MRHPRPPPDPLPHQFLTITGALRPRPATALHKTFLKTSSRTPVSLCAARQNPAQLPAAPQRLATTRPLPHMAAPRATTKSVFRQQTSPARQPPPARTSPKMRPRHRRASRPRHSLITCRPWPAPRRLLHRPAAAQGQHQDHDQLSRPDPGQPNHQDPRRAQPPRPTPAPPRPRPALQPPPLPNPQKTATRPAASRAPSKSTWTS